MNDRFDPPPSLVSARLDLRPVTADDAGLIHRFNADPVALEHIARDPYTDPRQGEGKAEDFVDAMRTRAALWWVFEVRDTGEGAGYGGLFSFDRAVPSAEIGYGLLPDHWGCGYAGEAVEAMVRFGLDELALHRIHARVHPGNEASERILLKLGFEKEGVLRHVERARGRWFDMAVYGLVND